MLGRFSADVCINTGSCTHSVTSIWRGSLGCFTELGVRGLGVGNMAQHPRLKNGGNLVLNCGKPQRVSLGSSREKHTSTPVNVNSRIDHWLGLCSSSMSGGGTACVDDLRARRIAEKRRGTSQLSMTHSSRANATGNQYGPKVIVQCSGPVVCGDMCKMHGLAAEPFQIGTGALGYAHGRGGLGCLQMKETFTHP